jgi:hypothetical protein
MISIGLVVIVIVLAGSRRIRSGHGEATLHGASRG